MSRKKLGVYLHIPYCVRKCAYCDFLSFPMGDREIPEIYLNRLMREIEQRAKQLDDYEVDTVFFGGGTPSLLSARQLQMLCDHIRVWFHVADTAEWSMECNPGTADREKLTGFCQAGINRLSIGLQTPQDELLKRLGRIHTWEQFVRCFDAAREAGFANINVDLMSALPGQTLDSYTEGLRRVLRFEPEHVSSYSLILEEGTPLYDSKPVLPDEETDRLMYETTGRLLREHGYQRYEISNYARLDKECRHNVKYWTRGEYLGLGLGAASLINEKRLYNVDKLQSYLTQDEVMDASRTQTLTKKEQMEESMFLGLRMMRGIEEETFQTCFGVEIDKVYGGVLAELAGKKLIARENGRIFLTDYGIDISNYVLSFFLLDER